MSDIGPVNRAAHLRAPFPWLRHQIKVAALSLQGDGEDHHAARLFAELPADERGRYAAAAARLRGEVLPADPPT